MAHNLSKYHLIPHLHIHLNPKSYNKEEFAIYLTHTIKFLALALIGVYVPVYVFVETKDTLFFSTNEITNGLVWVLTYYGLKSLAVLLFTIFISPLIFSKLHFQKSLLISSIGKIIEFLLFTLAPGNIPIIMLAAIFSAVEVPFYWIPYHVMFLKKLKDPSGHYGKKTSFRFFLGRIVSGISPLIGGLIIAKLGFPTVFVSAILLLLVSNIPIMTLVNEWKHHDHKIKNVYKNFIFNPKLRLLTTAYIGQGMEAIVVTVFWSILLFLILDSYIKIGALNSISLLATSITLLIIGRILDKGKARIVHGIGVINNVFLYIMKALVNTPVGIYAIDIADKLNGPLYGLPNMSLSYEKAKKLGASDFMIYREIVLHFSIVVTALVAAILVLNISYWQTLFLISALGSIMAYAIDRDNN